MISLKEFKEIGERYSLIYIDSHNSLYLNWDPRGSNAKYKVAKYESISTGISVWPLVEIDCDELVTNFTKYNVKTESSFIKRLEQYKESYKLNKIKLKEKEIAADFV